VCGWPNIVSNEAGAVCDELFAGPEVSFFRDFPEPPDFEVVWRFGEGTIWISFVDGGGDRREYVLSSAR